MTVVTGRVTVGGGTVYPVSAPLTLPAAPGGMLLGGRVVRPGSYPLAVDFAWGEGILGPLQVTRAYNPNVPTTYSDIWPAHTIAIESWNRGLTLTSSLVNSLPARTRYHVYQHEPERPTQYGNGGGPTYIAELTAFRNHAQSLDPTLKVGHAASGYAYRNGAGVDGSYIKNSPADFFTFDAYRAGTDENFNAVIPIQDRGEFQTWYGYVQATGKPWGITEAGMGRVNTAGTVSNVVAERESATKSSIDWCRANGAFCFSYFFSGSGPDGNNWLPDFANEPGFVSMWQAEPRG